MRAIGLTLVLILAKVLVLAGREVTWSWWSVPAYFWHDVAVGAAFGLFEIVVRRQSLVSIAYYALVVYAALNVPVSRALSSPLTVPMWRAAGGPLLDSVAYYVTAANIGAVLLVVAVAVAVARMFTHPTVRLRLVVAAAAVIFIALGLTGSRRVATLGLERNAVTALVTTMTPRMASRDRQGDWRSSPFAERSSSDLSAVRGAASGMNVVLLLLESTGAQYLAPYGALDDPMPNLTALARGSLLFENAYAVYPESIKGLFSTLCARPPAFDVDAETHARSPCTPLTQILAGAGYRTALFHSGRFTYLGMEAVLAQQRFDTTADAGAIGGNVRSSFGVEEPATVQHMLSWIDQLPAGQRFFLAYLPAAGHHPYASPVAGPFAGETDLVAYKNALHYGDASLGAFLDGFRQRGLRSPNAVRRRRRPRRSLWPARRKLRPFALHLRGEHQSAAVLRVAARRCHEARRDTEWRVRRARLTWPRPFWTCWALARRRLTTAYRCCGPASGWRSSSPTTRSGGSGFAMAAGS